MSWKDRKNSWIKKKSLFKWIFVFLLSQRRAAKKENKRGSSLAAGFVKDKLMRSSRDIYIFFFPLCSNAFFPFYARLILWSHFFPSTRVTWCTPHPDYTACCILPTANQLDFCSTFLANVGHPQRWPSQSPSVYQKLVKSSLHITSGAPPSTPW